MTIEEVKKLIGIREDQIWLLKAALFAPEEAINYWERWKKYQNLNHITKADANYSIFSEIDTESLRVLPLIYRKLEHTDDSLLPALKDAYRTTWMSNQKLLYRAQEIVRACNEAGIPNMLLKGIPMSLHYYKDMGVRPMGDVDLLVPLEYLEPTISLLATYGNIPDAIEYKYRHLIHAMHCFDEGGIDVDLHWQAFFFQYYTEQCVLDKPEFRQPLALSEDSDTSILSDSYQLFHTIIHGTIGGQPTLRWIPDAYTILKKNDKIDLKAIFDYAQERNVQFALYVGLKILTEELNIVFTLPKLPDNYLVQKLYFTLVLRRPKNNLFLRVNQVTKHLIAYYIFSKPKAAKYFVGKWISQKILFWHEMKR